MLFHTETETIDLNFPIQMKFVSGR